MPGTSYFPVDVSHLGVSRGYKYRGERKTDYTLVSYRGKHHGYACSSKCRNLLLAITAYELDVNQDDLVATQVRTVDHAGVKIPNRDIACYFDCSVYKEHTIPKEQS